MHEGIQRIQPACKLVLAGKDCQKWLNQFCTNDLRGLQPAQGCEAFVLTVKGKTLCHMIVLIGEEQLTLLVTGLPAQNLAQHFDRYIIREDVRVEDRSDSFQLWWQRLPQNTAKPAPWSHETVSPGVTIISSRISSFSEQLIAIDERVAGSAGDWSAEKWSPMSQEADFQIARIRGRWPLNSVDLTDSNLPQEFARDSRAISFQKGCYLGQETVARIDALGHVNQRFVQLIDESGAGMTAGSRLFAAGEPDRPVGTVTSVATAEEGERIGLAFIRMSVLGQTPRPEFQLASGSTVRIARED